MVICRMVSSKHWSKSSSRTGHSPISLACRLISRFSNSSCSWMTSILVAGVDRTVCTHNWPLSVRCSLGGRICPRMSYVWCCSSSFLDFAFWAVLAEPLTRTGVEYLTKELCYPSIVFFSYCNFAIIVILRPLSTAYWTKGIERERCFIRFKRFVGLKVRGFGLLDPYFAIFSATRFIDD